jgi:hypothetical protein
MKYFLIAFVLIALPLAVSAGRDFPKFPRNPPELPLPPVTPPTPPVNPPPHTPEAPSAPVTLPASTPNTNPTQDTTVGQNRGGGGQPLCLREPRFSGRDCPCIGRWGHALDQCLYVYQQEKAAAFDALQRDINRAREMLQKMLEQLATWRPTQVIRDFKG